MKCLDSIIDCVFLNHVVTPAASMDIVLTALKVDRQARRVASALVLLVVVVLVLFKKSKMERIRKI